MAQATPRSCPRCGSTLQENQHFCARCGYNVDASLPGIPFQQNPSPEPFADQRPPQVSMHPFVDDAEATQEVSWQNEHPMFSQVPELPRQASMHPNRISQTSWPPKDFEQFDNQQANPLSQRSWPPENSFVQVAQQTAQPTSSPPPRKKKNPLGVILLILAILIVLGAASYGGYVYLGKGGTPKQSAVTTTSLNTTINYAGVDITTVSAQQTQLFLDDPKASSSNIDTTKSAMLRLNMQAQNKTNVDMNIFYDKIATLVVANGQVIQPLYIKGAPGVAQGATQTGMIDFIVPINTKLDQTSLRIGAANEAQMDMPLTANADMGKYAPKTVNVSGTAAYQGLNWTLTQATLSWNVNNQQASKGMQFVALKISVDNTLTQTAIPGSPFDFLRLNAGKTSAAPQDSTLPLSYAAQATGKTGTVTFQVPQNAKNLTLVFRAGSGFDQQTIDFHL